MERTLIIIKPDAVNRGLTGEILRRFEYRGVGIVALKMQRLSPAVLEEHYAHHKDKPFFADLVSFMSAAPVVLAVLEGADAISVVREMVGATNARKASPGTIRGDLGMSTQYNCIHASEDPATAQAEIERFFKKDELHDFAPNDYRWVYAKGEA